MTKTIEQHVDIAVPAADAYAQWTQFKDMPNFMKHVAKVRQVDDRHLEWQIRIGGKTKDWTTEITEQIPDKRIAWTGTGDTKNAGCVTFHRLADDKCRVMLQMEIEPEGVIEKTADIFQVIDRGVASELASFRDFIEARDRPTGRWKGQIPSPDDREQGATS